MCKPPMCTCVPRPAARSAMVLNALGVPRPLQAPDTYLNNSNYAYYTQVCNMIVGRISILSLCTHVRARVSQCVCVSVCAYVCVCVCVI